MFSYELQSILTVLFLFFLSLLSSILFVIFLFYKILFLLFFIAFFFLNENNIVLAIYSGKVLLAVAYVLYQSFLVIFSGDY